MNKDQLSVYKQSIFEIKSDEDFNRKALEAFRYQFENVAVYRTFCNHLGKTEPKSYKEIPFLPISFFKTHRVCDGYTSKKVFKSSGTTGTKRSEHYIADLKLYEKSFLSTYKKFFGDPKTQVIIGLLPNYLEQGDSSLIYMVKHLIEVSRHQESGFYLNDYPSLINRITQLKKEKAEIILFGVSYALLDLADLQVDFSNVKVIETGGMKGRRKEMLKEELHSVLKKGLQVENIYSEYGMTELLSQAYLMKDQSFFTPNWMKILIRDVNDPLSLIQNGSSGGMNVIDLANIHSCSFIATDDLGVSNENSFEIKGRLDLSDIRGCNLLVN